MEHSKYNNSAVISGRLDSELQYSHSLYGEAFYSGFLAVPRLSGTEDLLPVTVPERLFMEHPYSCGEHFRIEGQLRSYNRNIEGANRLMLTVFARSFFLAEEDSCENAILLTGYLCKSPIYRKTPFSREIADLLLAVNRGYNKSDYLPCIAWGKNARFASELPVGQQLCITGRMQSRGYQKQLINGEIEGRTAYEVSVSAVECV